MQAIEKVLPHSPWFEETVLAKDQPQYKRLPVAHVVYADGAHSMVSCYKVSIRERLRILIFGKLWIEQLTGGGLLQPQKPTVREPYRN